MKYLSIFIIFAFIIVSGVYSETDVPTDETPELVPLTDDNTQLDANITRTAEVYTDLMWAAYCSTRERITREPRTAKSKDAYDALIEKLEFNNEFSEVLPKSELSFIYAQRAELRLKEWQYPAGAEEDARTSLDLNPESVNAAWILGKTLADRYISSNTTRNKNKEEEMFTALKRVIRLDPDHHDAHIYLGSIAGDLGRPELAITSFKALTRIMPFRPQYHNELGKLYERQNRSDEALNSYERVLTISPDSINAHYSVGIAYQRKNNFEKAEYHIKRAVELLEERVKTSRIARMRSRDRIVLAQRLQEARYQLGQVYLRFNAPQKAVSNFEDILSDDGKYIPALIGIGIAYHMLDDVQRAENYLRKAIESSPTEEPDAYNALGYLYAEQGIKLEEAETLVRRALKSVPTSGAYLDSLGLIYFKQGKLDAAIENLEQAARYLPDELEILEHLADAYLKKGLEQKALQTLEHAVQLEPDNTELRQKLGTIRLSK